MRVESLESRFALDATFVIVEQPPDWTDNIAPEWLAPKDSETYKNAIRQLRDQLGWPSQEPILLDNGEWYFGPAGPNLHDLVVSHNENAADTTNTDQLRNGGGLGLTLDGTGVTVGMWEVNGRARPTHQEFGGRVAIVDNATTTSHATHVAGTIGAAGINAAAEGMAPNVLIRSRTAIGDTVELNTDAAAGVIDLSNHSYGLIAGWEVIDVGGGLGTRETYVATRNLDPIEDSFFGKYQGVAQGLDTVLFNHPQVLSVWSAGNHRNDRYVNALGDGQYVTYFTEDPGGVAWHGADWYLVPAAGNANTTAPPGDGNSGVGYDSLSPHQTAKNALAVGAVGDLTADPFTGAQITMESYSSWGPTDDGRIKPDVVANGQQLTSTWNTADNAYGTLNGTSMSAPNVTGTAALLLQHYRNLYNGADPWSSTLKGLLIHTATDAGNAGPDYQFGWGLVNAAAAANFVTNAIGTVHTNTLLELEYRGDDPFIEVRANPFQPLTATIVWTDPAPTAASLPGPGLDDPTPVLVNDLDLWITDESGRIYFPWTLDPNNPDAPAVRAVRNNVDNVEQVRIASPGSGIYRIHIGRDKTGPTFTQDVSVLISGHTGTAPPVIVRQPPDGAVRQTRTDVEVQFPQPVNGVDASDLTVTPQSGQAAPSVTSVTSLGNNAYRFRVTGLDAGKYSASLSGITSAFGDLIVPTSWQFGVVLGDLDSNAQVNGFDLLVWQGNMGMPNPTWQDGDLDGDGDVDNADGQLLTAHYNERLFDLNSDDAVTRDDVAILMTNWARQRNVTWLEGDINYDRHVDLHDLRIVQLALDPPGEQMMAGGGESGGEQMQSGGGEEIGDKEGEEQSGGGEALTVVEPARFYFTTSASMSGGGTLGTSVPEINLSSPGATTDLYVWVDLGTYQQLHAYSLDISATVPGVVKATQVEVYQADIRNTATNADVGDRWDVGWYRAGTLNPDGVGEAKLVSMTAAGSLFGGVQAIHDGSSGLVDTYFDPVSGAFLLQRVRLEALPDSNGQATGLVLSIGQLRMAIDDSTVIDPLTIHFGLGTSEVSIATRYGTDGTTHATIGVGGAGSPGAAGALVDMAAVSLAADRSPAITSLVERKGRESSTGMSTTTRRIARSTPQRETAPHSQEDLVTCVHRPVSRRSMFAIRGRCESPRLGT